MLEDLLYSLPALLLAGIAQCWLLTSIARRVSPRLGIVDKPDGKRKVHTTPTPLMGGVAIFLSLVLSVCEFWYAGADWLMLDAKSLPHLLTLFISAGLFCGLGLWDDRFGMRPLHKFIGQIVASLPFVLFGMNIQQVSGLGWVLDLGVCGIPLTIFWLVACSNLINLMDGLDGLAASISLVVAVTISILAMMVDLSGVAGLNLILAGVLLGFLMHNWNPARIFMGDSGSLTLGFLIGAFSLEASLKTAAGLTFVPLIVLLSIPMFDTSMAIVRRKLNGRGIGEADRQHFHHCLRDLGLSTRQSVLVIAGLCAMMGASVIISVAMEYELVALALCGAVLSALVFGNVFGSYEFELFVENVQTTMSLAQNWIGLLGQGNLLTRVRMGVSARPMDTWELLINRIKASNGKHIEFRCIERSVGGTRGELMRLHWSEASHHKGSFAPHWNLSCQVAREGNLQMEIAVSGDRANHSQRLHLDSLQQMLQSFCELWPVDAINTLPFAGVEPRNMTPQVAENVVPSGVEKRVA